MKYRIKEKINYNGKSTFIVEHKAFLRNWKDCSHWLWFDTLQKAEDEIERIQYIPIIKIHIPKNK